MTNTTKFFQFESDFVDSLRCIPMQVRYKLDTCGVKLKLSHWNHFTPAERQTIVDLPCETPEEIQSYREFLQKIVTEQTGEPAAELPIESLPEWLDETTVPIQVTQKAEEFGAIVTPKQWTKLSPLERFALIKLSRSSHENRNFLPALQEFHLI